MLIILTCSWELSWITKDAASAAQPNRVEGKGGTRGGVGGGGWNIATHERAGLIHSAKIKLFGYRIDLPELKPNVNLYIKLNTSKSQVNRYLENVLYRVVEGNLKIQNNTTA
jgi:hypothetical protein